MTLELGGLPKYLRMPQDIKLKDIAMKSGVSVSTVSRVLSGDQSKRISPATADAVARAARDLGWYSSAKRRGLAGPMRFGVLFVSDHESIESPFFSGILEGIRQEAELTVSKATLDVIDMTGGRLPSADLDGAVMLGRASRATIAAVKDAVPRVVYAGLNRVDGMDEVLCDAREGMKAAVELHHAGGAERIAYLGPTRGRQPDIWNEHRHVGYLEGLAALGLAREPSLEEDCFLTAQGGAEGAVRLWNRARPDAIVCANDQVAIGALGALRELGADVPGQVSVTGFDNIEVSAYSWPRLTTFDVPKRELGRFALKLLVDRMENPRTVDVKLSVPWALVERDSTRQRREGADA